MRRYDRKIDLESAIERSVPRPVLELSDERLEKIKVYSDVLLALLGVATVGSLTVLAPNALQALEIFEKRHGKRRLTYKQKIKKMARTFQYLRRWGRIEFKRKGQDFEVKITNEGKKMIRKLDLDTLAVPRQAAWDGRFWQVAADIPTKEHKREADALRRKLREMNFCFLQRTLWFYPYDPRVEVEFAARSLGIANFVTVMKIEKLDPADEKFLLRYFKDLGII